MSLRKSWIFADVFVPDFHHPLLMIGQRRSHPRLGLHHVRRSQFDHKIIFQFFNLTFQPVGVDQRDVQLAIQRPRDIIMDLRRVDRLWVTVFLVFEQVALSLETQLADIAKQGPNFVVAIGDVQFEADVVFEGHRTV
jgi:hypothetical protein